MLAFFPMDSSQVIITKIEPSDSSGLLEFTDRWIGKGYFSREELTQVIELSGGASFKACVNGVIVGVRLSIKPGSLMDLGLKDLSVDSWGVPASSMAYFKSLFVAYDFQGQGIGKALSSKSLEALKELGALGVVCHSWLESPGDSSRYYLQKMGFDEVRHHPRFWYDVDYHCTRCAPKRCVCTAVEMIKVLS